MIGAGSFGSVYKLSDNRAVKVVENNEDARLEIDALLMFRGKKHIVTLLSYAESGKYLFLYFPLYAMDLHQWILKKKPFDKRVIMSQIANAICEIHSLGFFHRDIKPMNVLMDEYGQQAVIADFGWSMRDVPGRLNTNPAYTLSYRAPEILKRQTYTKSADIFALGMLFFFVFNKETIVDPPSDDELFTYLKHFYLHSLQCTFDEFKNQCPMWGMDVEEFTLWKRCVKEQPELRPTIHTIYNFFQVKT